MKNKLFLVFLITLGCNSVKQVNSVENKEVANTDVVMPVDVVEQSKCPQDMVHIDGDYCLEPIQKCTDWMSEKYGICRTYDTDIKCNSDKVHMNYCMDKFEASDESGMPVPDLSWTQAKTACEQKGKRLCQEREWTFACEGEQMLPYPYGVKRDPTKCNFELTEGLVDSKGNLADHRVKIDATPNCVSPFGIVNLVGNIDEWVVLDNPHYSQKNNNRKMMSGLKGGWWGPLRNRCRPTTVDHDEHFHEFQTGYRCCKDS